MVRGHVGGHPLPAWFDHLLQQVPHDVQGGGGLLGDVLILQFLERLALHHLQKMADFMAAVDGALLILRERSAARRGLVPLEEIADQQMSAGVEMGDGLPQRLIQMQVLETLAEQNQVEA